MAVGMKEVTRTWKIVGGVTHADSYYKNGWIVMIAIGWARGNIDSMCSYKYCYWYIMTTEHFSSYINGDYIL